MINLATHGYLPTNVLNNATWEFLDIGHLGYLWMPYFDGPFPRTLMMAQAVSSQQCLLGHHKGMDLKKMNQKTNGFVWKCWVYSQWNSHLIGIMISKTIGFRGLAYFQTHPYKIISFPTLTCSTYCSSSVRIWDSSIKDLGGTTRNLLCLVQRLYHLGTGKICRISRFSGYNML